MKLTDAGPAIKKRIGVLVDHFIAARVAELKAQADTVDIPFAAWLTTFELALNEQFLARVLRDRDRVVEGRFGLDQP